MHACIKRVHATTSQRTAAYKLLVMDFNYIHSYKGHSNSEYKLDSCLSHDDACVVSGSEDGRICFWDLVEVKIKIFLLAKSFGYTVFPYF